MASYITEALMEVINWLLDPVALLSFGFTFFGWVFAGLAYLMPGPLGDSLNDMSSWFGGVPLTEAWKLVTYFSSPVIDPTLLSAAVGIRVNTWCVCAVIKLAIYAKNTFWSAAA